MQPANPSQNTLNASTPVASRIPAKSIMLALFLLLISVYMLTYSGNMTVNDELMMFNATGSLVRFGDKQYDLALWYQPPQTWDTTQPYPLSESNIEPMQMIAAAPLYWLAFHIPGVGLVHAVWLLNVLVTAAAGVLMFWYARRLGYAVRTSLAAALMLCFGTAAWVYSQTFFREPLAMLLLLAALIAVDGWRRAFAQHRLWQAAVLLGLTAALLVLAILTRYALAALIPAYLIFAMPVSEREGDNPGARRAAGVLIIVMLVAAVAFAFTPLLERLLSPDMISFTRYSLDTTYSRIAIHSYLFSIGGSLWGSSPVILLAIPGAWLLWRRGRWRLIVFTLVALMGLALTYALFSGPAWFGGASWPPRFLVSLLPFLVLLTLPAVDALLHNRTPRWVQVAAVALLVYSIWWQVAGLMFPIGSYSSTLPEESGHFADWLPGMNRLEYLRPLMITRLAQSGTQALNSAWVRTRTILPPLLLLAGAVAAARYLSIAQVNGRRRAVTLLAAAGLVMVGLLLGLRLIYDDPHYRGDSAELFAVLETLEQEAQPGDVVVLNDPTYANFFLNYARVDEVRFVALALHPGERGSFEQEPQVVSDVITDLMSTGSPRQLNALAATRDRLWLLMETGPFLPWSIRPVEQFMTTSYYLLREFAFSPTVRLLEYDTTPQQSSGAGVRFEADFVFGGSIRLEAVTLPEGLSYRPGETIPASLMWRARDAVTEDYTVAFFLGDPTLSVLPVQGTDSMPAGGFRRTSQWEPGQQVVDKRALRLPEDFPPGEYDLWVRLYRRLDDGSLEILPISGEEVIEINGNIAVLPVTVTVEDVSGE